MSCFLAENDEKDLHCRRAAAMILMPIVLNHSFLFSVEMSSLANEVEEQECPHP